MVVVNKPAKIDRVIRVNALVAAKQNKKIEGFCIVQNAGAQVMYFDTNTDATATTGIAVPANSTFPFPVYVPDTISLISNATGTDAAIIVLDI